MLILARRLNESVMIGDDVRVTVVGIKGGQVRLAFTAPPEVTVDREEIAERKRLERTAPASAAQS